MEVPSPQLASLPVRDDPSPETEAARAALEARPLRIEARGLGRRFGSFVAVQDLDLEVAAGEVFGLLGPNGAGKTTTVRMLAGIIAPSEGSARVVGHDVVAEPERVRAKVGILTETPGLYVRLDALENLQFFADLHAVPNSRARIEEVLRRLDLYERRLEPVGGYSKGMRQRLAIARAILHEPEVLFLDEPTSALDPVAARGVRELVTELSKGGRTIVLCTHNLDEAERLCDRIAIIRTKPLCLDTPLGLRRALGGAATRVRLAQIEPRFAELLRTLEGVLEVELSEHALRVRLDDTELRTPSVVRALVDAGAQIHAVTEDTRSLEQAYLDLVDTTPIVRTGQEVPL